MSKPQATVLALLSLGMALAHRYAPVVLAVAALWLLRVGSAAEEGDEPGAAGSAVARALPPVAPALAEQQRATRLRWMGIFRRW